MHKNLSETTPKADRQSLFSAKVPPKLKRPVNKVRLEKSSYEESVAHRRTRGKTNHPEERCLHGARAHLEPKYDRPENSSDNNPESKAPKAHHNLASSNPQSTSKKVESKN